MKITHIGTGRTSAESGGTAVVFLRTDDGFTGIGEVPATTCPQTLSTAVEDLIPRILGRDPFDLHAMQTALNLSRGSIDREVLTFVMNGVEAACLDAVGKRLGVPVTQLLGGSLREYVRVCATSWEDSEDVPQEYARKACEVTDSGFTAIKFDPFGKEGRQFAGGPALDRAVAITESVRRAVGTEVDLIVDANGRFTPPEAIRVASALAPFGLLWLENPLQTDDLEWWEKVAKVITVPVAAGGPRFARHNFRDVIEQQLADFVQPDLWCAGGISEARSIALLAETFFMGFAFHHSGGPVTLAIEAQLSACAPNFTMMEMPYRSEDQWNPHLKTLLQFKDGCLRIPSAPGWGIEYLPEMERQLMCVEP
jgi:galactonate dehydratase